MKSPVDPTSNGDPDLPEGSILCMHRRVDGWYVLLNYEGSFSDCHEPTSSDKALLAIRKVFRKEEDLRQARSQTVPKVNKLRALPVKKKFTPPPEPDDDDDMDTPVIPVPDDA